jgi:putative transposase
MLIETAEELATKTSMRKASAALGIPRSSLYRLRHPQPLSVTREQSPAANPRALSTEERAVVRDILNSEQHQDQSPRSVYAQLLDEGSYLCHWRTMYRILDEHDEVRERRNQVRHPAYAKPELLATAPNQVWSWDITKLKGPAKWTCFHLYVILDIFSRFVVGWLIAPRECAELAQQLIADTVSRHNVQPGRLTLHADRGAAMRSKPVASLLVDLDVAKSHSRPHVSDDNPYSESQFKTMKYRPTFPQRFGCIEDARAHCQTFFAWYNAQHCHSGIAHMTPHSVHYGLAAEMRVKRQTTLDGAFLANPNRFKNKRPQLPPMPTAAWINPPHEEKTSTNEPVACTLN